MPRRRRPRELRERKSSSDADAFLAKLSFDLDDVSTWPPNLSARELAVLREAQDALEEDVADFEETARKIDEADEGLPRGRILAGGGQIHVLYKAGGGYIRYSVPSDSKVSCNVVGCCDPRRTVSAGRT